jgi:hypothetical protein
LQKQNGSLRRAPPDKLTPFALAVLHVDIRAGIFQAAILKLAIHVDAVVQHDVLIFKGLIFKSIHGFALALFSRTSLRLPFGPDGCKIDEGRRQHRAARGKKIRLAVGVTAGLV